MADDSNDNNNNDEGNDNDNNDNTNDEGNESGNKEEQVEEEVKKGILMEGTIFTVEEKRSQPKLHFSPSSLNSQKAHACVRQSSLDYNSVEKYEVQYPEELQTLDFCRLNPNMSIPVLEIDDKIITDSREIQKYLRENYPGLGDEALINGHDEETKELEQFLDTICAWDEYLFSYRSIPKTLGDSLHNIRLCVQSNAIQQAVQENALEETLRDGQTIRQAYVKKIAQTRALIEIGSGEETPQMTKRIETNDVYLDNVMKAAMVLFQRSKASAEDGSPTFLLGKELTSADAFFAAVVNRVQFLDPEKFVTDYYPKYNGLQDWWEHYKAQTNKSDVIIKYSKKGDVMGSMLFTDKPWKILGYKIGVYAPRKLPEDIEADVQSQYKQLLEEYLK